MGPSMSGTNPHSKEAMPAMKSASFTAHNAGMAANATTRFAEKGNLTGQFPATVKDIKPNLSVTNLTDSELQQVSNNERVTLDIGPSVAMGGKSSAANMTGMLNATGATDLMNLTGMHSKQPKS